MFQKIECTIKSYKLGGVTEALKGMGIDEITLSDAKVYDPVNSPTLSYRGIQYKLEFQAYTKIETIVSQHLVNRVIETITRIICVDGKTKGNFYVVPVMVVSEQYPQKWYPKAA